MQPSKLWKLVPTEFLFSTATTTTINHKMPMDKGIDHVVVVEFWRPKSGYYHHYFTENNYVVLQGYSNKKRIFVCSLFITHQSSFMVKSTLDYIQFQSVPKGWNFSSNRLKLKLRQDETLVPIGWNCSSDYLKLIETPYL